MSGELYKKYIYRPFSILDSTDTWWTKRKKLWKSIGIMSEESREDITGGNSFNSKRDTTYLDGSVNDKIVRTGLVSIFDPVLCELMYTWYCPNKCEVLDPFAGVPVRGIVSSILGHNYYGIDLRKKQIVANNKNKKELSSYLDGIVNWDYGDSESVLDKVKDNSKDFILSCPPYHDLEVYSNDDNDLSNIKWNDFLVKYDSIIKKSVSKLKKNRFACFVITELRDKDGFYKRFVPKTIDIFEKYGCKYYNEMILKNSCGSISIRVPNMMRMNRKTGRMHQNVLIFFNGDDINGIREDFEKVKNNEHKYIHKLRKQKTLF